jgi:putative effector of murein hydrolase LrgA (UPF0299 family)
MWLAWTVFSLVQYGSKRWFAHYYKVAHWIHVISGGVVAIITISASFVALVDLKWEVKNEWHNIVGIIQLSLCLVLTLLGLVASMMRHSKKEWNTSLVLAINKAHKYSAWAITGFGQLVCYFGIFAYIDETTSNWSLAWGLTIGTVLIFLAVAVTFEVLDILAWKKGVILDGGKANMTPDEFVKQLDEGRELVLLEGLVLDVSGFIKHHPGGQFVL